MPRNRRGHLDWARQVRDQCAAQGVAFFRINELTIYPYRSIADELEI